MSNQSEKNNHFISRKVRIDAEELFNHASKWKTTSINNGEDLSHWPKLKSSNISSREGIVLKHGASGGTSWVDSPRRKENGPFPQSIPPPLNRESLQKSNEKDHFHLDLLCPSKTMDSCFHLSGVQSILHLDLDDGADAHCHNDHFHGNEAILKGTQEEFSVPLHRQNDFFKSVFKSTSISSPTCHDEERNITNNFSVEPFMYEIDDIDRRKHGYHKNGLHYFKDSRERNNYDRFYLENGQDGFKLHQRGNKTRILHRDYHSFQNLKLQNYPHGRYSKSDVSKETARENRFHQRFGQREFHHNVKNGKIMEKNNQYNDEKLFRSEKEEEIYFCNEKINSRVADTNRMNSGRQARLCHRKNRKPRTKGVLFRRGDDGRLIKC